MILEPRTAGDVMILSPTPPASPAAGMAPACASVMVLPFTMGKGDLLVPPSSLMPPVPTLGAADLGELAGLESLMLG